MGGVCRLHALEDGASVVVSVLDHLVWEDHLSRCEVNYVFNGKLVIVLVLVLQCFSTIVLFFG